jgi:16S rRNA U1498 N3-methylase RsmE
MRKLLVEGLCQAEVDCAVPKVTVYRNLRDFLRDETRDSTAENFRIIAHPPLQEYNVSKAERTAVAAGPEQDSGSHRRKHAVQSVDSLAPVDDELTALLAARGKLVKSPDSLRFSTYTSMLRADAATTSSSATSSGGSSNDPYGSTDSSDSVAAPGRGMVIAVGPEGGWTTEEVRAFQRRGFQLVNLGPRILRTDIAVRSAHHFVLSAA